MTLYSSVEGSSSIIDAIQTNYQCCGQNSWLDWGPVDLGGTAGTGTGTSTNTGTGTSISKDRSYIGIGNTIF